ncbi:MAG: tetratricopeptide repeat protein [Planctomycetota bacterium]
MNYHNVTRRPVILLAAVFCVFLFLLPVANADEIRRGAVLQFYNEGDSSADWIGAVLVDSLSTKLGSIKGLAVVDSNRLTRVLSELYMLSADLRIEENILKIKERLGVDMIVVGSYKNLPGKIEISVELVSSEKDKLVRKKRNSTIQEPLTSLTSYIGKEILELMNVKSSDTSYLQKKATDNLNALESYGKGLIFKKNEKTYDKAIESFIEASKIDPEFAAPHYQLGCLFVITEMLNPGIKEYLKATRLDPEYAEAYNNLGVVYSQLGRTSQALEVYKKAVAKNYGLADAHCNLGKLLDSMEQYEEAIKEYKIATELSPKDAVIHNNLAVAYLNQGKKAEAEKSYLAAIAINPDLKEAHLGLGLIYDNDAKKEKAVLHYERYISLDGQEQEIIKRLEELKKSKKE